MAIKNEESISDLRERVVSAGLTDREEASMMSLAELKTLIDEQLKPIKSAGPSRRTSKKSSSDESAPIKKAPAARKTTSKKSKATETKEPKAEEVVVTEEKKEEADIKVKKSAKAPKKEKKTTKSKPVEDVKNDETSEADTKTSEVAPVEVAPVSEATKDATIDVKETKEKKTRKTSKTSKKTKTEDKVEVKEEENPIEKKVDEIVASAETTSEVEETAKSSDETKVDDKKNQKRRNPKAKKTSKKPEEKAPEAPVAPESPAPAEANAVAPSSEVVPTTESPKNNQKKPIKVRKRKLSFGPQENGEVVVTEIESTEVSSTESNEEKAPEVPEVVEPEIQYIEVEGVLSIGSGDKGDFNGFIHKNNYLPGDEDAFVQGQLIRRMGLRRGDYIKGLAVAPKGKEKYAPLKRVLSVNGIELTEDTDLDVLRKRKRFESLTAIYPDQKLKLETDFGTGKRDISTRIIDLFSPIGKGQRGMIVSPPKAGKTVLLKKVANAIKANNPNCHLIVLLIDERPEEVTDMQRSINGEVVYSTFDKKPENHVRVTELVLERAMRLVEIGEDVVILLDSMTRLARAYNLTINPTGRTLSGGLDPGSLYGPKRFFGAARNIENGGSLTIIATALIETGSRMDEVIFEEFKGTGNMEVTLDRKLADRRVFPAIAVDKSGTRREDLLLTQEELEAIWLLRKKIADVDTITATDAVINFMQKTTNNNSFVLSIKKSFSVDD